MDKDFAPMTGMEPAGKGLSTDTGTISVKRITKERYIELTRIATSIVDYARMNGVNRQEGCILREIAERYFNL